MSQAKLIRSRRFMPLFWTQFLGAFNDNVYKNALVILIVYQQITLWGMNSTLLVTVAAGIFILPFFLFAASGGQLADKYEKSMLIQRIKMLEIGIMTCAFVGFSTQNVTLLIILLFMMGMQSALFGPVKYSILPQLLKPEEMVGGNGLIAMGTFLAILLGTILGGILIAIEGQGPVLVSFAVVCFAVMGLIASFFIPKTPSPVPDLKLDWNFIKLTTTTMRYAFENKSVFIAILAIAWFWFVGGAYLAQLPAFTKHIIGGNEHVVTLFLTMFSIGIGIGAIFCERLSRGQVEPGLVPLGALGIIVFSVDIYFSSQAFTPEPLGSNTALLSVSAFLSEPGSWRLLADLVLIGFSGGLYSVPLQVIVQTRSNPERRARVIAASSIFNSLLMVISAIYTVFMLKFEVDISLIFLSLGLLTLLYVGVLLLLMPEFMQRFMAWIMGRPVRES